MGSPKIDAAPPPPDYAEANREGIYTDIETLPIRRQIDQASRLGQRIEYVDPNTGETRVADFTGLGDMVIAQQAAQLAGQTNADIQRQQLALRQELGLANAQQTTQEVRAADPLAYDTRQDLTAILRQSLNQDPPQFRDEAGASRLSSIYDQATQLADPALFASLQQQLGSIGNSGSADQIAALQARAEGLRTSANDPSTAALNLGLGRAVEDFQRGGALDPNVRRELLNEARATQAARGNYLGDAAALVESQEMGSAMERREAQRLATLLDVQQRAFGQNSALRGEEAALQQAQLAALAGIQQQGYGQGAGDRQEIMQRIGARAGLHQQGMGSLGTLAQLQQQAYGQNQATDSTNYGRRQQTLANVSAMVLGQPITNQFGALGSAQQGAVGYNPVGSPGGIGLNAGAGQSAANFGQQNYSQQSQNWQLTAEQQAKGSPWMSILGNVAGAAAGAGMAAMI